VTIWSFQGILTRSQSHLAAQMIDLAPTISQAAAGRRKSAATTACSLPYRNRELRPITDRLGCCQHHKAMRLPVESPLRQRGMVNSTQVGHGSFLPWVMTSASRGLALGTISMVTASGFGFGPSQG
jgi:hypothetical protein